MKPSLSLFLLIAAFAAPAAADTCVRIENHTDEYYYMGEIHTAVNQIDQIWFGGGSVAYVTGQQKFVFTTSDSSFFFVNLADSSYVESTLPFDWDLFRRVHRDFLELSNYDEELIAELLKIEGFSAATETTTYIQGFSVNSHERVIGVSEKPAPPDLYAAPEGFRKKSELTLEDING